MHDDEPSRRKRTAPDEDRPRGGRAVLLTGGGSGGHVFPALAIADALLQRGWQVSYAGSALGLEARLVPARGLPFHALAARPVLGRGALAKVRALFTLAGSALRARALVKRLDARAVVATGGYVAVPAALGGRLASRPLMLVEPNAQAGLANRALAWLAREASIAYSATAGQLRCPTTVTGVPVREAFFAVPPALPAGPPRLLVLGGSQGARQLNELVPAALARVAAGAGLGVVHQCGARHLEATRAAYRQQSLAAAVEVVPFLDDVASAMARSHLVVSRAGAITLAELCAAGRPSVLLPLAIAGAHQVDNARALAATGAALAVIAGPDAAPALAAALAPLLAAAGRPRLAAMAAAARAQARAGAAALIADRVETLVAGGRG